MEVWADGEPAAPDVQHIEVGGDRTRRGSLVALAVLLVVVVGGLLLGGGDDRRRSGTPQDGREASSTLRRSSSSTTSSRAPTTAPTSTTVVLGPILPASSGAAVLIESDSTGRWTWLDLGTGVLRSVEVPTDEPYNVVAVRGGVVARRDGSAHYVPLPEGDVVDLGPAEQILSAGRPDAVWLLRFGEGGTGGTAPTVRLAGLDGGVQASFAVPQMTYANGATNDGMIFTAGGRAYLARADGVHELGVGDPLSVAGPFVVLLTCDDRAECTPDVIDTRSGRRRPARGSHDPPASDISALVSPTGAVAVARHQRDRGLSVYDASGRLLGDAPGYLADLTMQWLHDGSGLVAATQQLSIVRPDGDGGLVRQPIRGVDLQPDVVLVIPS